jgi:uncharacterized protein (TIGR02099 family)
MARHCAAQTVIILMLMIQKPTQAPTLAPARWRWLAFAARIAVWVLLTFWLLVGATWAVLHGWIVPRIEEFRPRLEITASKALGVPVRIDQITAQSHGLMPSFELQGVTLQDSTGRQALLLPRVLVALTATSLWGGGFEQLVIDQPVLDIRRTLDGKLYVGGIEIAQGRADGKAMFDWFFSQTEFAIQDGTLRWTDERASAPMLVLEKVDAVMRNGTRRHAFRMDATPPAIWGDRFSLRGQFRQPLLSKGAGQWADWSGQLYAEFGRVADVSQIKKYMPNTLDVDPRAGSGSLRAWADVSKGQISGTTLDVAMQDVDVQLGKTLQPLVFKSVMGRVGGKLLADGFEFSTENLRFDTPDGLQWPGGNLVFSRVGTAGTTEQKDTLKADKLDLAAIAQIASRLPLGTSTHALMASFAPKGLVETLEARWQMPADNAIEAMTFKAKGRVTGLEVSALPSGVLRRNASQGTPHQQPGRPGISGGAADFDISEAGGKAQVSISQGHLDLPGVLEDPRVQFDKLAMDTQWTVNQGKLDIALKNIRFSGADAEGTADANWRSGDSKPGSKDDTSLGILDLKGVLTRANGARVHRYLPLVLPEPVRHYVRDAVLQGDVSDVVFLVKGPVDLIPFSDPSKGDFKISAKIKNGRIDYAPKLIQSSKAAAWPGLVDVTGELVFHRAALDINNAAARVAGLPGLQLVKADARIPDLMQAATLELTAKLKGPLGEALGFVNTSPLAALTRNVLAKATASGVADYALRLDLPLNAVNNTRVKGSVTLPGNDVQFTPDSPLLTRLKGMVTFTETGFSVPGAQARLLGGDVRFEGGMRPANRKTAPGELDSPVLFKAQGTVSAEGLRQAKDLGPLSRLAQSATGSTAYTAALGFNRNAIEVILTSNLQGMALALPAPLNKTAEAALPLRYENTLLRESMAPGQKLQDYLSLGVGRLLSLVYVRDISSEPARVIRGSIGVGLEPGESTATPDNGVAANVNLASLNLDAWEKVFSSAAGTPAALTAPVAGASQAQSYLPNLIAIRAKELVINGRKLNNVVVGGTREGQNWRANIDAGELNGYLEFRQPGTPAGRVMARLSRLSLAASTASEVESILDEQPAGIPALDIVINNLELRGRKLGRIEIDAVNRAAATSATTREWRLNKFNITTPEAVLAASGNWAAADSPASAPAALPRGPRTPTERRRTTMNFKLDIMDSGELLKRFGMGDVIRRGKGKMEGQIAWLGSPLSLDYPSMSGQLNLNIDSGQFLKADPGIAKLLGVLSLQSLPRRLALDFRDVFSEGFAFDFVRGDVAINQGIATTNNLQMKGVNAAVLMEGSADIAKETQDLRVVVVPEINAGTASLITAVINPVVGLGTFLAQYFLRQPLIKASTQEFHIDGSWADPKITKVERTP